MERGTAVAVGRGDTDGEVVADEVADGVPEPRGPGDADADGEVVGVGVGVPGDEEGSSREVGEVGCGDGTGCTVALLPGDGSLDCEGEGVGDPLGVWSSAVGVGEPLVAGPLGAVEGSEEPERSGVAGPVLAGALGEGVGGVGGSSQGACTRPPPYAAPSPPTATTPLSTIAAPVRRSRRGTGEAEAEVAAVWARRATNASSTTGSGGWARRVRLTSSRVRRFLMSLSYPHTPGSLRSAEHRSTGSVVAGARIVGRDSTTRPGPDE